MVTNITYGQMDSLPKAGPAAIRFKKPSRQTLASRIAVAYRALSAPAPLSKAGMAYNLSYRALPIPR